MHQAQGIPDSANGRIEVGSAESRYVVDEHPLGQPRHIRVVCIGAGASGLNLAHQVEKHMQNVDFCIYEKDEELGGTWWENRSADFHC